MDSNNNVGRNEIPAKLKDDAHLDLTPTVGTDVIGGVTGQVYTPADLLALAVANGATFRADGSALTVTDVVVEVEVDLKPINGEGFTDGGTTKVVATTSDAAYQNNGGWTDIDPSGGRQDGEDGITTLPTSVDQVFVANGSVLTVHLTFQKA